MEFVRELDRKFPSRALGTRGVRQVIRSGQSDWAASIPDELFAELSQGEEQLRILRKLGLKSYISVPLKSRSRVLGAITFVTAESGRVYDLSDVRVAEDLAHRAVIAIENVELVSALKESDRKGRVFGDPRPRAPKSARTDAQCLANSPCQGSDCSGTAMGAGNDRPAD